MTKTARSPGINIGIVGLGDIAAIHLRFWRRIAGAHVTAVCDTSEPLARATARAWHIPAYYAETAEMLSSQELSVVDICTPPQTHCGLVLQALQARCHVMVEKPLAVTADEAATIVSAQQKSGRKVGVIHNILSMTAMPQAISLIRGGGLGKIINVNISLTAPPDDAMLRDENHWYHSLPGGRFGEMLVHPVYVLQAILGRLEVTATQALKAGSYSWVPFDELWVNLKNDSSSGSIYVSFNSARSDWSIEVFGTKGILRVNPLSGTMVRLKPRGVTRLGRGIDNLEQARQLVISTAQNTISTISGGWRSTYGILFQAFMDTVLRDKAPLVTLPEASDSIATVERICRQIEALRNRQ